MSAPAGLLVSRAFFTLDLQDQFAINRGLSGVRPRVLGNIRFWLIAQSDPVTKASVPFPQPLEMKVTRNPSGLFPFSGKVVMPDGVVCALDLEGSPWTIRIVSDFYQTLEQPADAMAGSFLPAGVAANAPAPAAKSPQQDFLVQAVLLPGPAYPFPNEPPGQPGGRLRGALRNPDGSPVAGATVQAFDANNKSLTDPAHTADDCQWVLVFAAFPPAGVVTVRFTYPDSTTKSVVNVQVVSGRENNLPQTALRGQVRLRKTGIVGAVIQVKEIFGEQAITDANGNWFYYFAPDNAGGSFTVTATLPDKSATKTSTSIVKPQATVVVPTFDF